jgi:DNA recombination-dependent growth factor C
MIYKIQIDDVIRDATPEEISEIEAREAEAITKAEADNAKAEAKAALLERLGITADEAALLLG